jgi:DNA-binding transcriptional MerR regulator
MIGEVSARTGLSVRTIRHYDHTGIVVPSDRSVGGFRLYSDADVRRLELVKTLRPLDLSLDQVRELLESMDRAARSDGSAEERDPALTRLAEVRALADRRVESMRGEIAGLERLVRDLRAIEHGADVDSPGRH